MFPYFMWHCSIPYYQANTGYWSCRNGIIMPNCYPLVIQLHRHINFAMNKWQKLVSVACIDLASATFRRTIVSRGVSSTNYGRTHQLAVFVSKRFLQTGPNSPVRAKFVL